MVTQYLIDTNSVIDYLDYKLPIAASKIIDNEIVQMSVITRIELLAWPNATKQQLQFLQSFINNSIVHALDEPTILETINIRRTYKLKLPDAIIAATAIINNVTLFTRNISDFKKVPTLLLLNPFTI